MKEVLRCAQNVMPIYMKNKNLLASDSDKFDCMVFIGDFGYFSCRIRTEHYSQKCRVSMQKTGKIGSHTVRNSNSYTEMT